MGIPFFLSNLLNHSTSFPLNGKLGFLAEPSDKKSWILQLERILKIKNSEKQKIIEERLDLLEKTFIWEKIFTETYNLHDE